MKKRADGRYVKKVMISDKPRYFYGKTIKEVEDQIFKAKKAPTAETSQSKRFGYWADAWWAMHKDNIKHNTQVCYTKPLEDCKSYFKDCKIDEIKPLDVARYIKELSDMGFARQTVKVRHIVLSKIFDYAILNCVVTTNPVKVVEIPKGLSHKERETLTDEQIEKVNQSGNLFAMFLLYTGLRRNEALAVRWKDINFEDKLIYVTKQVLWQTGAPPIIVDTTKSKSGNRAVPLLKPLAALLKKQKKTSEYVFPYKGGLMSKCGYKYLWDKVEKDCGDDTISAHQFRHAYITMLWESGIDAKTAQKLAGHSKVEIMLDIYTHLNNKAAESATDKLDEYLEAEAEKKKESCQKSCQTKITAV